MNKPLEALDKIDNTVCLNHLIFGVDERDHCDCQSIEDFVYCYDTIEKSLKALEIIKEKPVVALVDYKHTYEEWLELVDERNKDLFKNKEEYDLLREVLL